jgi:hypothetical protein
VRVFATPLPARSGAIAVLVDTRPFFETLRILTTEPGTRLLVIGGEGEPTPVSDGALRDAVEQLAAGALHLPAWADLVGRMARGEGGTLSLDGREASRLGFGDAEVVAIYAPIHLRGGHAWSVSMLTSTASLRSAQQAATVRLFLASGAIAICLIGFGLYVTLASRRAVALRERLRNANRVAHLHEKAEKILENIPTGVMALSDAGRITAVNRVLRERIPPSAIGEKLGRAFPASPASVVRRIHQLVDARASASACRACSASASRCSARRGSTTSTRCRSSAASRRRACCSSSRTSRRCARWPRSWCAPRSSPPSVCWRPASRTRSARRSASCAAAPSTSSASSRPITRRRPASA